MATDFGRLIDALAREGVEFVVVGGVAVVAHGYPRATGDVGGVIGPPGARICRDCIDRANAAPPE